MKEEEKKLPGEFVEDAKHDAEPPAVPKPVDINNEDKAAAVVKDKKVSEIISGGFDADEEEYIEAKATVSQQPESKKLSPGTLDALNNEQLAVLLQNYQALLEKGEISQADFDQLRNDVASRI
ncbi:hypothetical protein ACLI09_12370 [Flavobacterium sp. RHBU_24]|uniref:hypothetical protein n=1 Tax=Flavobacterium sp. RHBU_24 TaxID=3391185 RepID=UPI00398484EF